MAAARSSRPLIGSLAAGARAATMRSKAPCGRDHGPGHVWGGDRPRCAWKSQSPNRPRSAPSISRPSRKSRAPDRGRRQGAGRLSEAARGRQDQKRSGRRRSRRGQDRRPGAGILALRPPARARTAGQPRPRLSRIVGQRGQAHGRRAGRAGGRRPTPRTSASPIRNGRRTSSSTSSSRPICSPRNGPSGWSRTPRASTSTRARKPSSTSSRSPTRSRRRISC